MTNGQVVFASLTIVNKSVNWINYCFDFYIILQSDENNFFKNKSLEKYLESIFLFLIKQIELLSASLTKCSIRTQAE